MLSVSREVSGGVSGNMPGRVSGGVSGNMPGRVSGGVSGNMPGRVSGSLVLSGSRFHTRSSSFHVCHFHPVHDSLGYISKGIKVLKSTSMYILSQSKTLQSYSGRPKIELMTKQLAVVTMKLLLSHCEVSNL